MAFAELIETVTTFAGDYPWLTGAAVIVAAIYIYREPKEAFKIGVLLAFLLVALYFITQFTTTTSSGVDSKKELTRKTREAAGD